MNMENKKQCLEYFLGQYNSIVNTITSNYLIIENIAKIRPSGNAKKSDLMLLLNKNKGELNKVEEEAKSRLIGNDEYKSQEAKNISRKIEELYRDVNTLLKTGNAATTLLHLDNLLSTFIQDYSNTFTEAIDMLVVIATLQSYSNSVCLPTESGKVIVMRAAPKPDQSGCIQYIKEIREDAISTHALLLAAMEAVSALMNGNLKKATRFNYMERKIATEISKYSDPTYATGFAKEGVKLIKQTLDDLLKLYNVNPEVFSNMAAGFYNTLSQAYSETQKEETSIDNMLATLANKRTKCMVDEDGNARVVPDTQSSKPTYNYFF